MSDTDGEPGPDPERAELLREIARDVRGDSSESELVAAMLYRVSDLYDPDEETTPEAVYRNMRNILRVTERGTLARD
ncbi:hypothetical protein BRC72_00925 [Halobacteriales archaeon QH_7_66_36]|jgi:hypothetical protein|nr:MAG: hypothetical protein BRC72_00925 [Halobacteriales archaeon QH_7_66_36]